MMILAGFYPADYTPYELLRMTLHNTFPVRSSLFRISQMRQRLPSFVPGHLETGSPAGNFTEKQYYAAWKTGLPG